MAAASIPLQSYFGDLINQMAAKPRRVLGFELSSSQLACCMLSAGEQSTSLPTPYTTSTIYAACI